MQFQVDAYTQFWVNIEIVPSIRIVNPTFANMTFASRSFAIGESHMEIRQYTPWTPVNWRKSGGHSPILAKLPHILNY
ncbi:unnamed protein product [Rotaria socialis]|uniref:Uncharacterized protein n=1 Tax=Rotaria socialis TaxID=392032 RepID=A0A820HVK7_9BILA|nr:unnamed protein product [Rotaria socialis]